MPLSAQFLATQRAKATADLVETCSIQRASMAVDAFGEPKGTWADLDTEVPCKVATMASQTGGVRQRLEALGQVTEWLVIIPWDQEITSQDRILVTAGESAGRLFEAAQVLGPVTNETRRIVQVEEVNG